MADQFYYTTHDSVIGKLLLVAGNRGVRYLTLLADGEDAAVNLSRKYSVLPQQTSRDECGNTGATL